MDPLGSVDREDQIEAALFDLDDKQLVSVGLQRVAESLVRTVAACDGLARVQSLSVGNNPDIG